MSIKLKQILSLVLSVALIFSMLPTYALGADSGEDPGEEPAIEEPMSPDGEDVTDPEPDVIDPTDDSNPEEPAGDVDEPVVDPDEPTDGEDVPEDGADLGDEPAVDVPEGEEPDGGDSEEPSGDGEEPENPAEDGGDAEVPADGEGDGEGDGETPEVPVDPDDGETAEPNMMGFKITVNGPDNEGKYSITLEPDGKTTGNGAAVAGGVFGTGYIAVGPNLAASGGTKMSEIGEDMFTDEYASETAFRDNILSETGVGDAWYVYPFVYDSVAETGDKLDDTTGKFSTPEFSFDMSIEDLQDKKWTSDDSVEYIVCVYSQLNGGKIQKLTFTREGYIAELKADPVEVNDPGARNVGKDEDENFLSETDYTFLLTNDPSEDGIKEPITITDVSVTINNRTDEESLVVKTKPVTVESGSGGSDLVLTLSNFGNDNGDSLIDATIIVKYKGKTSEKEYDSPLEIPFYVSESETTVSGGGISFAYEKNGDGTKDTTISKATITLEDEGGIYESPYLRIDEITLVEDIPGVTITPAANSNGANPLEVTFNAAFTNSDVKKKTYTTTARVKVSVGDGSISSDDDIVETLYCTIDVTVNITEVEAPETYTVTWSAGDHGTFKTDKGTTQTGASGTTLTTYGKNDLTADEGYEFDGWKDDEGKTVSSFPGTITQDVTYTAQWKLKQYTVTFYDGSTPYGNTTAFKPQSVAHGGKATDPGTPTKTGNRFVGWVTSDGGSTAFDFTNTTITANTSIYASWVEQVTLTLDKKGYGTLTDAQATQTGDVGFNAELPTLTETGWTFGGWTTEDGDASKKVTSYTVNATATLYALWTQNDYTAKWYKNGGTWASGDDPQTTTGHYGDALTPPTTGLTRSGYTQNGWNTKANGSGTAWSNSATYPANSNTEYYAVWEADQITVTWNANGGAWSDEATTKTTEGAADSALTLPSSNPSKTGNKFLGWASSNSATTAENLSSAKFPTTNGKSYHAVWEKNKYTVTYDKNGKTTATVPNPVSNVEYDSNYTVDFTVTAPEGYTFKGWAKTSTGSVAYEDTDTGTKSFTMPADNVTLYAVWEANTYKVTFNANDGAWTDNDTTKEVEGTVEDTIASKKPTDNPEREGYTFAGWYTAAEGGDALGSEKFPANNDKIYFAHWTAKDITVTWNVNYTGGTNSTDTGKAGASLTVPTPIRTGYTFDGWYDEATDGTKLGDSPKFPTKDTTYYAHWTINSYTVTFAPNGGTFATGENPTSNRVVSVNYDKTASVPGISRAGYTLSGWTSNPSGDNLAANATTTGAITQAVTYTAQWTANTLTVTVKLDNTLTDLNAKWIHSGNKLNSTEIGIAADASGTNFAPLTKSSAANGTYTTSPLAAGTYFVLVKQTLTDGEGQPDGSYFYHDFGEVTMPADGNGSKEINFFTLTTVAQKDSSGNYLGYVATGNNESTSASPETGSSITGVYSSDSSVFVNAAPITNYKFTKWTKGSDTVSTSAAQIFQVTGTTTLTANFEKEAYSGKVKVFVNGTQVTDTTDETADGLTDQVKAVTISGGPDGVTPTITWVSGTNKNYWEMNNLRSGYKYTIAVTTPTGKFEKWTWTQETNDNKVVEAKLFTVSVVGGAGNDVSTGTTKDFDEGKDSYFTDKNDPAGKTASIVIPAGENITVTSNQKSGYTLTGWTKGDNSDLPTGAQVTGDAKDTFSLTTDVYKGTSDLVIMPVYTYELTLKTWYNANASATYADGTDTAPGGTVATSTSASGANAGTVTGSNGVYTVSGLTPGATYNVSVNGFTSDVTFTDSDITDGVTVRLYKLTTEVKPDAAAGTASINVGTSSSGIIYVPKGAKSGDGQATIYVSADAASGYRLGDSTYGDALWTSTTLTVPDANKNEASTTVTLPAAGASADMTVTATFVKAYQMETAREDTTNANNTVKAAKLSGETAKVEITDNGVLSNVTADMKYNNDGDAIGTIIKVTATIDDGDQVKGWKVTGGKLYSDEACTTALTTNSTTGLLGTPTVAQTNYDVYFVPSKDLTETAKVTAVYQSAVYDAKVIIKLDGVAQKGVSVKLKKPDNTYTAAQTTNDSGEATFSVGGGASGVDYAIHTNIKNTSGTAYDDSYHTITVKKAAVEQEVNFFTVSYDLNDADAPTTLADVIVPNNQATGTVNGGTAPTKAGYVFNGWNKYLWDDDGGDDNSGDWNTTATTENMSMSAIAGDTVTAKVKYQAQWMANQVTIQARLDNSADTTRTGNVQLRAADGTTIIATGKALSSGAVTITSADCESGKTLVAGTEYKIYYELGGTYTDSKNTVTVSADTTATGYVDFYSVTYNMASSSNTAPTQTPLLKGQNLTFPNPNPTYNATSVTGEPTFKHWSETSNTDATAATAVTDISAAKTYYAVWQVDITWDSNEGTISGMSEDESKTESLIVGATLTAPTVTRTNYELDTPAWKDGSGNAKPTTVPAANTTYIAQWKEVKHTSTVTVKVDDKVQSGKNVTITHTPTSGTAETHTAATNASGVASFDVGVKKFAVTTDVTTTNDSGTAVELDVTASGGTAEVNYYTVTFDLAGGSAPEGTTGTPYATQTLLSGGTPSAIHEPVREGYKFLGWNEAKTPNADISDSTKTTITAKTTYTAQWEANKLTVWVYLDDTDKGHNKSDDLYTETPNITLKKNGTTVKTAALSGGKVEFTEVVENAEDYTVEIGGITGSVEVAKIEANTDNECIIDLWTVTFKDALGGTEPAWDNIPAAQTILDGEKAKKPSNPTKAGYVFDDWYETDTGTNDTFDFDDEIGTTTNVYAKWTANKLTITVTLDSATDTEGKLGKLTIDGTEYTLDSNGKYEFTPIVSGSKHTLGTKNGTGTKEVTGKANDTQTETLNYNTVDFQDALDGTGAAWANNPADQYILDANHATTPSATPTKAGYVFLKWTTDEDGNNEAKFDNTENVTTTTKTYYAQWTPNTVTVNVTLDGNAYTALNSGIVPDGDASKSVALVNASATFSGVTVGNHTFMVNDYHSATKTVEIKAGANTVEMPFFTIQFNKNAGTDTVDNMPDNVVKYTGENYGGSAASETPTRAGYTFLKWTMDAAGNTTANWSQNITATNGVIYYAQWSQDTNGLTISDVTTGNSITPHAASTDGTKTATNAVTRNFNAITGNLGASGKPYKLTLQNKGTTALDATVELYQFTKATLPSDLTTVTWNSYSNLNNNSGSYTYTNDSRTVVTVTGLPTSAVNVPVKGESESEAEKKDIGTITIDGGAYNVDDIVLVFRVTSHKTGAAADTLADIYYVFDLTVNPLPITAAKVEALKQGTTDQIDDPDAPGTGDTTQLKAQEIENVSVTQGSATSNAKDENLTDTASTGDLKYQWFRADVDETVSASDFSWNNGTLTHDTSKVELIDGATAKTYTVTDDDLGKKLYMVVYAAQDSNASGFAVADWTGKTDDVVTPVPTKYTAKIQVALNGTVQPATGTDNPGYTIKLLPSDKTDVGTDGIATTWDGTSKSYTAQLAPDVTYKIYAETYKGSSTLVDTTLTFTAADHTDKTVNYYTFIFDENVGVKNTYDGFAKYLPDSTDKPANELAAAVSATIGGNNFAEATLNASKSGSVYTIPVLDGQKVKLTVNATKTNTNTTAHSWSETTYQSNHTLSTIGGWTTGSGDNEKSSGIAYAASIVGNDITVGASIKDTTHAAQLDQTLFTVNFIVQESTGGNKASVKNAKLTVDTASGKEENATTTVFAGTPATNAKHGTTIAFQVPQSEHYTISAEATDTNTVLLGYKWLNTDTDKVKMNSSSDDWANTNRNNQILIVWASSGLQWLDDHVATGTFAKSDGYNDSNLVYGYTAPTHVVQVQNTGTTALSDFHITSTDTTPNFTATTMATAKMFTADSTGARTYLNADGTTTTNAGEASTYNLTATTGVTLPAGAFVEFNIDVVADKDASDTAYTAKFTATGTYAGEAKKADYNPEYTVVKAPITFVNALGIDAPAADATPDTATVAFEVKTGVDGKLTGSTLYPGASLKGDANTTVTWYVGGLTSTTKLTSNFENGKQYTAEVTLTPGDNYEFDTTYINTVFDSDGSTFDEATDTGYFILNKADSDTAVSIKLNENGTLTLRYTFPATAASLSNAIASSIWTVDGEKNGRFNSLTITADETNKQDVYYILATVTDEDHLTAPSAEAILKKTSSDSNIAFIAGTDGVAKGSDGNGLYGSVTFDDNIKFTSLDDGTKYYVFAVAVPHGTDVSGSEKITAAAALASNVVSDSFTTPFSVELKLNGIHGTSSITKPDPNPTYVQAVDDKVPTAYINDGDEGIETGTAALEMIRDTAYVISGEWVDTITGTTTSATGDFGEENKTMSSDNSEETITNSYKPKENTVITVNFDGEPKLKITGNASGGKLLNWKYGASANPGDADATDIPSQIVMDPVDDDKYGKVTNTGTKSLVGDATLIVTPKYVWRENKWQLYTDAMFAADLLKVKSGAMNAGDLPTSTYFNIALGNTTNTTNTDWKLDAGKYGQVQVLAGAWRADHTGNWNLETPYKADGTTKTVTDTNRLSAAWAQAHQPSSTTDHGNGTDGHAKDYNVSFTTDENGNDVGIYEGVLRAYDAGSYTLFDTYYSDSENGISLEIRVVDEGWAGNPKDWVWDLNPRSHGRNESGSVVEDTYTDSTRSVTMTHKDWEMDINTGGYNSGSNLEAVAGQFGSTTVNTRTGQEQNSWNSNSRTYTFVKDESTTQKDYKLEHRATATTDADIYDFAFHVKTLRELAYTGFKKDVGASYTDYYIPDSGDWADFDLTLSDTGSGKTNTKTINLSFIDTRPGLKVKKLTQSGTAVTATIETIQHDNGPTAAPEYKTHNNLALYGENGTTDYTGAKVWLKNNVYDAHVRWYSVTPDQKTAIEAKTTDQAKFDYLKNLNTTAQLVKQSNGSNEGTGVLTYNYQTTDIGNYLYCTVEGDNVWFRDVAVSAAQYIAPTLTVKALRNGDHVASTTDYRVEVKSNKVAGDNLTTTGTTAKLGTTTAGVDIANKTLTFTQPGEVFTLKTNRQDTAKKYFFTNWSDVLTNVASGTVAGITSANGTYAAANTDLTATLTSVTSADTTLIAYYDLLPTLGKQAAKYDLGSDVEANRTLSYTQHDGSGNVTVTIAPASGHTFAGGSTAAKTLTIGTGKDCTLTPAGDTAADLVLDATWIKNNLILNGLSDGVYTITVKDNVKSTTANGNIYDVSTEFVVTRSQAHIILRTEDTDHTNDPTDAAADYNGEVQLTGGKLNGTGTAAKTDTQTNPTKNTSEDDANIKGGKIDSVTLNAYPDLGYTFDKWVIVTGETNADGTDKVIEISNSGQTVTNYGKFSATTSRNTGDGSVKATFTAFIPEVTIEARFKPIEPTNGSGTAQKGSDTISPNTDVKYTDGRTDTTKKYEINNDDGTFTFPDWLEIDESTGHIDIKDGHTVPDVVDGLVDGKLTIPVKITITKGSDSIQKNVTYTLTITDKAPTPTPGGGGGGGEECPNKVYYWLGLDGTTSDTTIEDVYTGSNPSKIPSVTALNGLTFKGWSLTKPEAGKTVTLVDPKTVEIKKDTTFYAVYELVERPYHEHYVIGYPNGNFGPADNINRASVATIIARAVLPNFVEGANYGNPGGYTDVSGHWAESAIAYCSKFGVFEGYLDGTFKPDQYITRQEFALVIARIDGLLACGDLPFDDADEIGPWALDGVYTAFEKGWVNGYTDGTFRPNSYIRRDETVKVFNAYLNRGVDKDGLSDLKEYVHSGVASNVTENGTDEYMTWPDVPKTQWAYYEIIEAANDHEYEVASDGTYTVPEHWTKCWIDEKWRYHDDLNDGGHTDAADRVEANTNIVGKQ